MKNCKTKSLYLRFAVILVILSLWILSGCEEFLDKQPLDQISNSTFWKTENDAMLALTGVYYIEGQTSSGAKQKYDLWNQDTYLRLFEATTDNGFEKDNNVTDFNNGSLTAAYAPVTELWVTSYWKIAKCNNFLENIGNVAMDETKKAQMIAEIKTIRAYDYFWLQFLWGDVPLVTKVLTVQEANTITRTSRSEVVDFVISELSSAIPELPITRPSAETGRITRGSALAILGRVQMADKQWSDAVNTYKQIIDLGIYSIDPRFKELFEDDGEGSPEYILTSVRMQTVYGNSMLLSCLGAMWGGFHHYSPYNELVQEFECTDGLPIDKSPLYQVDDPYKNRDPRLYETCFINLLTVFKGRLYVSSPDSAPSKYPDMVFRRPYSGYCVKKFCDEDYTGDIRVYGADFPMIRYAEVLLSYLESNIEAGNTITQNLLDATINKVRGRAAVNMPPITETNPAKLTAMVRRERRVELAWEGLRLYDLFRWNIAHIYLRGKVHGMKFCTSALAPTFKKYPVDANGYYVIEETFFRQNVDYLWPIPQTERDVNANLTQNPGY